MPQTLSQDWVDALVASGEPDPWTAHEALIHTIGNITLTCENPELGNMGLDEKRAYFAHDILRMNDDIAAAATWARKEIQERSRRLGSLSIGIWSGPLPDAGGDAEPQWDLMKATLSQLPEGRWTAYEDLAEIAEGPATAVREYFVKEPPFERSEAVLLADGKVDTARPAVAQNVRMYRQLLVGQGVLPDLSADAATPSGRFTVADFGQLLGEE